MSRIKNSPTTKFDMRTIEARRKWLEHWAKVANRVSIQYLESPEIKHSSRSWQGVARSGLKPSRHTQKHTGTGQHS
ncbi:MAG: hypothetical protein PHT96_05385 [Syntrophorhabdaceae bacterium]|nr:hypothetical protein [Syntrophorhabdaceae bacterium]MDD4195831.1 hypothetical protein [Syntrophorhabdaceae bacterium]